MHKLTVPAVAEKVPSLPGSMEDKDLEAVRTRRISMFNINVQELDSSVSQQNNYALVESFIQSRCKEGLLSPSRRKSPALRSSFVQTSRMVFLCTISAALFLNTTAGGSISHLQVQHPEGLQLQLPRGCASRCSKITCMRCFTLGSSSKQA